MEHKEVIPYSHILLQLKDKIKTARQKAILAVNNHLLLTYWEIGNTIAKQELQAGWGGKVIQKLATDLKAEFPEMKGLSSRNLRYMRDFSLAYPDFLQHSAAKKENTSDQDIIFLQQVAAKLPWGHHLLLLTKVKTKEERAFYIRKSVENGWSRSILDHHISSKLFQSQGALVNNFQETIPAIQSELTKQIFKDPYNFDFIMLSEEAKERDLENALMSHVTKVLLELGAGFAFMNRQRRFEAGGREFFVDLLFYHTKLRSHVIIELKIGDFEPEYVSKMNLYLGLADDQLRGKMDEPSIGLILCKTNNRIVAEYALRDTSKPIGIAEYKIAEQLPDNIKGELPTIHEIEERLDEELKVSSNPIDDKLKRLKDKINQLNIGEATKRNIATIKRLYYEFLLPVREQIHALIKTDIIPLFNEYEQIIYIDGIGNSFHTDIDFEVSLAKKDIKKMTIYIPLKGFKKAGISTFDKSIDIEINLYEYKYTIAYRPSSENSFKEMLYNQLPSNDQIKEISESIFEALIDDIEESIEKLKT